MSSDKDIWEKQYLTKGDIWRGFSELPFDITGPKVLEIGCGNGKTVASLISRGVFPVCLDISRNALFECKRTVGTTFVEFIEGDLLDMPFIDASFDSIVCYHVIEHLIEEERRISAREIGRVLKSGGKLLVQSFSVKDMRYGKGRMIEKETFERGDGIRYHYFDDGELEGLFKDLAPVTVDHRTIMKRYHGQPMSRDMIQAEFVKK